MNFFKERIEKEIELDISKKKKNGWYSSKDDRTFETHVLGDFFNAVFKIDSEEEAVKFYNGYLEWLKSLPEEKKSKTLTEEQVAKSNIGWLFGEGMSPQKIAMWNKSVGTTHPIFGSGTPCPKDPLKEGTKLGKRVKEK